jgi:hypothetical protein
VVQRQIGHIVSIIGKHRRRPSSLTSSRGSEVYRALAALPRVKQYLPVYYKIFPQHLQSTAIFNELFCYRLFAALDMPVADDVCMMPCRKNQIIGPSRCLENRDPNSDWMAGIASVDLNPRRVAQLPVPTELMLAELLAWPALTKAAVLDELLLNVDRNCGNMHRLGKNRFVLIDHEKAFGGPAWNLEKLRLRLKSPSTHNDLANFIAECGDQDLSTHMLSAADHYATTLQITEILIRIGFDELDRTCGLQAGTTEEIVRLLNVRCKKLPEFIFHHIRQGQLFQ